MWAWGIAGQIYRYLSLSGLVPESPLAQGFESGPGYGDETTVGIHWSRPGLRVARHDSSKGVVGSMSLRVNRLAHRIHVDRVAPQALKIGVRSLLARLGDRRPKADPSVLRMPPIITALETPTRGSGTSGSRGVGA